MAGVRLRGVVAGAIVLVAATGASAQMLNEEVCGQLRAQSATMIAAGVKDDLARGAEWSRQNLPQERVRQVLDYIGITERILFKCLPPPPPGPPVPERAVRDGTPLAKTLAKTQTQPAKSPAQTGAARRPPVPARKPAAVPMRRSELQQGERVKS